MLDRLNHDQKKIVECNAQQAQKEEIMTQNAQQSKHATSRRSFLRKGLAVGGAGVIGAGLLTNGLSLLAFAEEESGSLTQGDVAILRLLAAVEIIESDLWQQYNELGGIQDSEVPGGSGSAPYIAGLLVLDRDMSQYIHDNTEDEFGHMNVLNAYLASKGAEPVNLDKFRTLPSSKATGAQQIGRLTNLMQLTVDTSWWTRYRSSTKNPDFGDTFPQAIPGLFAGQFPAIPRNDGDLSPRTTSRRSPAQRASILAISSKAAPASTQRWLKESPVWRCCASCSVLAQSRPRTSRRGMTRL